MKFTNLIVILIIILFSCSGEENKVSLYNYFEYFEDGKLKVEADTIEGKFDGIYKEYYQNGLLHYYITYKNDTPNGRYIEYYINGNPKYDMYYKNDIPLGIQYVFHEDDSAIIKRKIIYSHYKGKPAMSSSKEYDKSGNIISDQSRVSTKISKDTFNVGENIEIKFTLVYPEFEKYKVHIGNFDRSLRLIDSIKYVTAEGQGHSAVLDYKIDAPGKKYIRGYMEDFSIKNETDSSYSTIGTLNNWFDIEIYIKDN